MENQDFLKAGRCTSSGENNDSFVVVTTYKPNQLKTGRCTSCGEENYEILIGDGRCIDCIECEKFYDMTMKGV